MEDEAKKLADVLKGIYIPPQPAIIERINEVAPDMAAIAALIEKDASIAGNIIKIINTSAFNLPNTITSIKQAVMLLGLKEVIGLVNGLKIRAAFEGDNPEALEHFWQLNEDIAVCCALLARRLDLGDPGEAYMLGLFHNCGIPAVKTKFKHYDQLLHDACLQDKCSMMEFIEADIHTSHCVVGYLIAKHWKLPQHICEAIRDHRDSRRFKMLDPASDGLLYALKMSEQICEEAKRLTGVPNNPRWQRTADFILSKLCLSDEDFEDLVNEIKDQM